LEEPFFRFSATAFAAALDIHASAPSTTLLLESDGILLGV
jgi:hypothetical protein